ncbi:MAG: hypothetical protein HOE83_12585 [Alphaproteobacteria bacterium]|nr:hypothetical protein [Alphaproteobacteria bacterium]MBT4084611.1 hypothetical protein [Alphaproteobacteria bacterium]
MEEGVPMKSRALLIAASCVIFIVWVMPNTAHADPVADAQFTAAKEIRKQLPIKVDAQTTLVAVVAAGRMAKYSYRLDIDKESLPSSWHRQQNTLLTNNVCSHPTMRKMMKIGASYSYLYLDAGGKFIADIKVRYSDC